MKHHILTLATVLAMASITSGDTPTDDTSDNASGWSSLFNGQDLSGWKVKAMGHELGEDPWNTVRVEDGMIRMNYDNYEGTFDDRFVHLFHEVPWSRYRLRVEYRFHGEQVPGGPGWAWRNSGAMLHCQDPATMGTDQAFPVSIEGQFLGGDGTNERSTGNLCTPGTHVRLDGKLDRRHCINSNSQTMHGDQWVTAEFEVDGGGTVRHFINGELVMEYEKPILDTNDPDAAAIAPADRVTILDRGWIALQGESHPVDFRRVEIKPLDGLRVIGGPILGNLREDGASVWLRFNEPGPIPYELTNLDKDISWNLEIPAKGVHDGSVTFHFGDLEPATRYRLRLDDATGTDFHFTTLPRGGGNHARIAFGSCAKEQPGSASVWKRMAADDITALVLLGDTPYIDTTDLEIQRRRYREFAAADGFRQLATHVPVYSTWDDHDIGRNDTDGNLEGKDNSRKAFIEHRPNPGSGKDGQGIFTSFRQGPVEVFILDTRWFARTEGGEDDPTLLGAAQWAWLERGLEASDAPFTILCNGMVFNGSVRPGKTDCWGRYPKEYDRLITLLERTGTRDVVLVSGDVHWSRSIRHEASDRLGFDLVEYTTSPIHEHLIKAADAPHPGLRWSRGEVNSFLLVDASTNQDGSGTLTASFRNAAGEVMHSETMTIAAED
ncbi:MAG: DUF1080 domain-containing protein [Phycisphaerales bacterium]|nr:DUF1080 domain-containing protein [Phycisphaerales bacterium]